MTNETRTGTSVKGKPAARTGRRSQHSEVHATEPVALLSSSLEAAPFDAVARQRLIAEAAYFRAAQRGFEPGHELDDWLSAESEVNEQMQAGAH